MTQPQPLKPFPNLTENSLNGVINVVQKMNQIRQDDQTKWKALPSQFLLGRAVQKIPANSADIAGNAVGDFNVTTTFAYFCVNNAGTAEWVRVAVGTF